MARNIITATVAAVLALSLGCSTAITARPDSSPAAPGLTGTIRYRLAVPNPAAHLLEVEIRMADFEEDSVRFTMAGMPGWTVQDIEAEDSTGARLPVQNEGPGQLRVERRGEGDIRLRYRVGAPPAAGRTWFIDATGLALAGQAAFMRPAGFEAAAVTLEAAMPPSWSAATPLAPAGPNRWQAPSWAVLADAPFVGGHLEEIRSGESGAVVVLRRDERGTPPLPALAQNLRALWGAAARAFGADPAEPFWFFVTGAGPEFELQSHAQACEIRVPGGLAAPDAADLVMKLAAEGSARALADRAIWAAAADNPALPGDLQWLPAGLSAYEGWRALVLTRLAPPGSLMDHLCEAARVDAELRRVPGGIAADPLDASRRWRAAARCAALDLSIRAAGDGRTGLAATLRGLSHRPPTRTEDIVAAIQRQCGLDTAPLFAHHVLADAPIDWAHVLAPFGVDDVTAPEGTLAASLEATLRETTIASLRAGGAVSNAGLEAGDVIVALDGRSVTHGGRQAVEEVLSSFHPGQWVRATVRRGPTTVIERPVQLGSEPAPPRRFRLRPATGLDRDTIDRRAAWLGTEER